MHGPLDPPDPPEPPDCAGILPEPPDRGRDSVGLGSPGLSLWVVGFLSAAEGCGVVAFSLDAGAGVDWFATAEGSGVVAFALGAGAGGTTTPSKRLPAAGCNVNLPVGTGAGIGSDMATARMLTTKSSQR